MNLIFSGQKLVVANSLAGICLPSHAQIEHLQYQKCSIQWKQSSIKLIAKLLQEEDLPSELLLVDLRFVLNHFSTEQSSFIIYAHQLIYYLEQNKFCSVCGSNLMAQIDKSWLSCNFCQRDVYPKINPAMIVAIRRGNQLLMAQAHHYASNNWGLLAGYLEIGENLETCVKREVYEEVGIQIKNIHYWGSQYWPFPNSLMLGFIADYDSGEILVERSELRHADFFDINNLPGFPPSSGSIAQKIIDEIISSSC